MVIVYWWLLPIAIIAIAAVAWVYLRKSLKKQGRTTSVPIAHSGRITQLPTYRRLYAQYRKVLLALAIVLGIGTISALILAARPVSEDLVSPQQKNRDIMLCLDVSGSMYRVDKDILATFRQLVENFQGQRIGLTAFNSSAVTIVPLTDDYDLLKMYLEQGEKGFAYIQDNPNGFDYKNDGYKAFRTMVNGTTANYKSGASLVGDGAASCVNRMGSNEQQRSQSIILATDNEVSGKLIATLPQVAAYAKSKNIRIYAVDPGVSSEGTPEDHKELKQSSELTGGLYKTTDSLTVSEIINDISKQEAALFTAAPEIVRTDTPGVFAIISLIVVAGLLYAAWRYRL